MQATSFHFTEEAYGGSVGSGLLHDAGEERGTTPVQRGMKPASAADLKT